MTEEDFKQVFTNANLSFVYTPTPEVIHRTKDGKVSILLFNTDDEMYEVDGIAANVWGKIVEKQNLPAYLFRFSADNNIPGERLCSDTVAFLQDLLNQNIIQSA